MKISLLLIIYLWHRINCAEDIPRHDTLIKYLDNQAAVVGEKLTRYTRNQEYDYNVKLNNINNMKLIGNYSDGEIFIIFNTSYALMNQDLYKISPSNYSLVHNFLPNEKITLLRTTEYKKMGLILFVINSQVSHIFGFNNQTQNFSKIQNIFHFNISDAIFFENSGNLYLIATNYHKDHYTSTVVYKFVNSHFDEIEKFLGAGTKKLYTFPNDRSEIIVVLQHFEVSVLYEFQNDKIHKIQKIDTENPDQILSYIYEEKRYVVICEKTSEITLYLWTGSELIFLGKSPVSVTGKKVIFYENNYPFLASSHNNTLLIFSLINNQIRLIHDRIFGANITKIWTYEILSSQNNTNIFIVLDSTQENYTEVSLISINISVDILAQNIVEEEKLSNCFLNLEKTVYSFRNKLTQAQNKTKNILREADVDESSLSTMKFQKLKTRCDSVKTVLNDYITKMIINKTTIIKGSIKADKMIAKNLIFEKLNNKQWKPPQWLSYSRSQNISGPVQAQLVQVKNLETNDSLFNDLLLANNQNFNGSLSVKNLIATQLETNKINNIPVDNVYYKSKPVIITGKKRFLGLNAKKLDTTNINGIDSSHAVSMLTNSNLLKHNFDTNLKIDNLWVENINGINFDEFKNSVFRTGHGHSINGSLSFINVKAKNMTFNTISKVAEVLTTSTDQIINSSITIYKIFTKDIETNLINGIDFKNEVATFNGSVINGPVSIDNVKVKNDLEMKGDLEHLFLRMNETHIVGTNQSDLLQRYNGKVTINGDLILKNFDLGQSVKMFLSGEEFDPKIDQFWTKTTQQEIPTHFEAQNGVSTPHLFTTFINQIYVGDYMLNSTQPNKPTKYHFDNVVVKGNVILDPKYQHTPDLLRIQAESVKVNGTFIIKGHKSYSDTFKVDKLEVRQLNGIKMDDLIKSESIPISKDQSIRNIIVKGNLKSKNLSLETINNVNIKQLLKESLYIDEVQDVEELNFKNVSVKNLYVTKLTGRNFNKIILEMNKMNSIDRIANVYVDGNVTIDNVLNLSTINGLKVDDLMEGGAIKYDNGTIYGIVKFLGNVKVRDLYVTLVNDIDLPKLSRRSLYKLWNQTVTEHFTFRRVKSKNLITYKINDLYVGDLVDISSSKSQKIVIPNGLKVVGPLTVQHLTADFGCNIEKALNNLRSPQSQLWENVIITGNTTFWDKESMISQIFDKAVSNGSDHKITGKIKFTNHICANNITTLGTINNIDMMEIIEDAFLNEPDLEQVVTGKKTFIQIEASDATSLQNVNVSKINDINILVINDKIVSKNSLGEVPITGKKVFFGGLQTKKLETPMILGVDPKNLISSANATKIPRAIFESIHVAKNFNVTLINKMPFDEFLKDRLLKDSPKQTVTGNHFFHNITIKGNVTTPHINDIQIENVINDDDDDVQIIGSTKRFMEDLEIIGNVKTDYINGLKLSEEYEQAVLQHEKSVFDGNLRISGPVSVTGNITTKFINNIPIDHIVDINDKQSIASEAKEIEEIVAKIGKFVHKYLNTTIRIPTEFLYLEKSIDLQIAVSNTKSAQIVETKDDILIHIESEEDGRYCGLPETCKCPVQQTMQISSEHSINAIMNKASQRVYSYFDDDINVHLISNSISTSSTCRTDMTKVMNEVSSLTWNTLPRANITGGFFMHQTFFNGYISGVKFFTIFGNTYVVIGFYYDPVIDTHDVDCLVLKFNEEKSALEEIQKIPTERMRTIALIHTAQGVVLIMGNNMSEQSTNITTKITTKIFRFGQDKEKFELLRNVPTFGSLFAVGVVFGTDSLIILANERSTLHILKYQEEFDNYYFYQIFQLDHPVSFMSVFYEAGFGISDAYLAVVTQNNKYFIYSFQFIEGWKQESAGELDGIKSLIPFKLNKKAYLFAPSSKVSSLLTLVKHDSN